MTWFHLVKKKLKSVCNFLYAKFLYLTKCFFFRLLCLFPVKKNKIVFISTSPNFSINPKFIYDVLQKNKSTFDFVWLTQKGEKLDGLSRYYAHDSIRAIYELVTAKIWIGDSREQAYFRKRKNQFYVMTWHGGEPLKFIEKDTEESLPKYYVKCAKADSKRTDLMIAETAFIYKIMKKSFWYNGDILQKRFIDKNLKSNSENREKIKNFFHIEKEKRIILYVPTFRMDGNFSCYDIDYEEVIQQLREKTGKDFVFIVRLHENIASKENLINYNKNIFNGTKYPSVAELVSASDFILSDYSSLLFQGYHARKNVIIYASDVEEYIKQDRGMYFDIKELPSPIATNTYELIEVILNYDKLKYENGINDILQKIGYYDGDAAKDVADKIVKLITGYK